MRFTSARISRRRRGLEAEHVVDEDRAVEVGLGEAVGLGAELGVGQLLLEPERVEVGLEVAADAVGADQHQRAQAVGDRLADLGLADRDALLGGLGPDLLGDRLRRGRGPHWPSRAAVSSSFGVGGQSARAQLGPRAFSMTSLVASSRPLK